MTEFLLRRGLMSIAIVMMVVAMAGYAGHSHGDAAHVQGSAQCDFCAAFAAVADLPAQLASLVHVHPDVPVQLLPGHDIAAVSVRAHPPRAPPAYA